MTMRRFVRRAWVGAWLGAASAAGVSGASAPVDAQVRVDAHALFQQGQGAYAEGDYATAIALWQQAYEADPRPLLQFNLSQAFERLGRLEEAVAALGLYLAHADPADAVHETAVARRENLEARIARTGVRVLDAPAGARVFVDGAATELGADGLVRTGSGSHELVVRADGRPEFRERVAVSVGESLDVRVVFAQAPAAALPMAPVALWIAGGVGLAAGGALGAVALSTAQSAPSSSGPEAEQARTLALAADLTMGVGAAAALVGVVLYAVDGGGGGEATAGAVRVVPVATRDGAAIVAGGSF